MNLDPYAAVLGSLREVGLQGVQARPNQLVVSSQQGPVWPNRGNSYWLSCQAGVWYLSTWLPAAYRVPDGQDLVAVCAACMEAGTTAIYKVPDELISRFDLEPVSDAEFERLFPEGDHEGV